jgi:hypothetical protein
MGYEFNLVITNHAMFADNSIDNEGSLFVVQLINLSKLVFLIIHGRSFMKTITHIGAPMQFMRTAPTPHRSGIHPLRYHEPSD